MLNNLKKLSPGKLIIAACILSVLMNVVLNSVCAFAPSVCSYLTWIVALINMVLCVLIIIRMFECGDKSFKLF